ncbi:uncharacterized protein A4U43_C05F35440 [Asparagus officinalis]|uniref:RNA methyltransferase At5g10620 n=1 Tax=Asparagus officinalis TaxID=4686 RepID=A0A5P1F2E9_ASPOF|nr:putative RNA methyltransferase At5g10620 [Asparagus officinalis]ONK70600.1 uncharacterized protein A4U43_C05F35440 [Asparagus officinalis]
MGICCQAQAQLPMPWMKKKKKKNEALRSSEHPVVQSIRAIPIRVLTVGKKRSKGIQLVVDEYKEKINYYCSMEDVLIRSNPKNTSNVKAQIEAEDISVIKQLRPDDWVLVLDEHGADITSEQLASLIEDAAITGSSRLSFCIGGPYGHGSQVRSRANLTIRLSSMVLNHQIALIVLLEQIYRAWTILKGQKYHH